MKSVQIVSQQPIRRSHLPKQTGFPRHRKSLPSHSDAAKRIEKCPVTLVLHSASQSASLLTLPLHFTPTQVTLLEKLSPEPNIKPIELLIKKALGAQRPKQL